MAKFKKGSIPWNKNKKGLQVSWNKGLRKETDKRLRKISEDRKGKGNPNWGNGNKVRGKKNPNWKGGECIDSYGYKKIYKPNHPRANTNGYVTKHMLIMEEKIGRTIKNTEVVHHIDGNPKNNNPKNLYLFLNKSTHHSYEANLRSTYCKWIKAEINI